MAYKLHEVIHKRAYTMLWMKWHTQCNNGLTPPWESLSHTHLGGHQKKTSQLEMRARVQANRGPHLRHLNAPLMRQGKDMEYDMQTCKNKYQYEVKNSPVTRRNDTRCMKMVPKCKIKPVKWLVATSSMHYLLMTCEERFKEVPK